MNPLTARAREDAKKQAAENVCIALFCGAVLSVLCVLFLTIK